MLPSPVLLTFVALNILCPGLDYSEDGSNKGSYMGNKVLVDLTYRDKRSSSPIYSVWGTMVSFCKNHVCTIDVTRSSMKNKDKKQAIQLKYLDTQTNDQFISIFKWISFCMHHRCTMNVNRSSMEDNGNTGISKRTSYQDQTEVFYILPQINENSSSQKVGTIVVST